MGVRDSVLLTGCVGNKEAVMWYLPGQGVGEWKNGPMWVVEGTEGALEKRFTLHDGEVDYGKFQPGDPPPFYDLHAPKYDRPMTDKETRLERSRLVLMLPYIVCV